MCRSSAASIILRAESAAREVREGARRSMVRECAVTSGLASDSTERAVDRCRRRN